MNARSFCQLRQVSTKPPATPPCKNPLTPHMFLYVPMRVSHFLVVGHSNQCPSVTSHHTGDWVLSWSEGDFRRISRGVKGERRNTLTTNRVVPVLLILIYPSHASFAVSAGSIRLPFSAAKYLRVRKGWCIYVTQSRHNTTTRQISDASPSLSSLPCRCWQGSPSMLSMQITRVTIQLIW